MKKLNVLFIILLSAIISHNLFSQELKDVNSVIRPISSIFKTEYGMIVYYPSYKINANALYIPNSWFRPPYIRPENQDNVSEIYAKLETVYKNLRSPYIEFFYVDNKLDEIRVHLTESVLSAPQSYLPAEISALDLETLFKEQESATVEIR